MGKKNSLVSGKMADKAQIRFDELMRAIAQMSEKDWQAFLNNL